MYYVVKKYIFLQKTYTLKLPCEKKGIGRGLAELENSKSPDNAPGEFHVCKADRKLLREKKGDWEGLAELENSKSPDNAPGEFHVCKADRKLLREKKGDWRGTCGTGIGGYICQMKKVV